MSTCTCNLCVALDAHVAELASYLYDRSPWLVW